MRTLSFVDTESPLVMVDMPDPTPGPGQVVLAIGRCGICGTDVHRSQPNLWTFAPGVVPGHEFAGEIVAVGSDVSRLRIGQTVTALPYNGCGACAACLSGDLSRCPAVINVGTEQGAGAYAEYLAINAASCLALPAGLSMDDGAIVEPFAVGAHAVTRGRVGIGDRVLVVGAGPIGLAAAWWAKKAGASRVVVAATSTRRERFAAGMGADGFVVAAQEWELAPRAAEALGGEPDVVVECVGLPGAINTSMLAVGARGRVVVAGACSVEDTFVPLIGLAKEIEIIFSTVYSLRDFENCLDVLEAGEIGAGALVTDTVGLVDAPAMFSDLRDGADHCKVLIDPGR